MLLCTAACFTLLHYGEKYSPVLSGLVRSEGLSCLRWLDKWEKDSFRYLRLLWWSFSICVSVPERSSWVVAPSSLPRPVSMRVLNSVPMGSRGWPTQPSRLVTDVMPLCSSSVKNNAFVCLVFATCRDCFLTVWRFWMKLHKKGVKNPPAAQFTVTTIVFSLLAHNVSQQPMKPHHREQYLQHCRISLGQLFSQVFVFCNVYLYCLAVLSTLWIIRH